MAEPLHLTYALLSHGQTDALRDGRVRPNRIEWQHVDVNPPPMIYRRMVRNLEFDVAEVAMTTFLCAKALERPISALPVFSNRDLTLSPIVCRADSDIEEPGDLEGKRVGIRSYTETNTTQARALLRSELGLDTDRVTWVITEDAHVAEYTPPSNVQLISTEATLEELLEAGEIDAALGPRPRVGSNLRRLLSEEQTADIALRFYRRTGVYPIGHTVVVKDETLRAHPWLAAELFQGFKASKQLYLDDLPRRSPLGERDRQSIRNMEIVGGDPLPYGLRQNRKSVEGMVEMNLGQHIIPRALDVDSLFAPGTLDLE